MSSPLFISIEQTYLTPTDKQMLSHAWVGGVVIFSKNFTSRAQIQSLIAEIKAIKSPALVVCVDHEGGRVQRFRQEFTVLPPMHKIGELYDADAKIGLNYAFACGYIIGKELGEIGIDFSFTPVLDLDYGQSSVIGDRSFHQNPQTVVLLAGQLMAGLKEAGMVSIGKHFPGHGYVVKDSHLELPQDLRDFNEIHQRDLIPFMQLQSQLAGMMTAHVIYPQVDANIATFSPFWLQQVLRKQMGYQGLIFSDDLMMKATDVIGNINTRAHKALDAGCDILLLCNDDAATQTLLSDSSLTERQIQLDLSALYYRNQAQESLYIQALTVLNQYQVTA